MGVGTQRSCSSYGSVESEGCSAFAVGHFCREGLVREAISQIEIQGALSLPCQAGSIDILNPA